MNNTFLSCSGSSPPSPGPWRPSPAETGRRPKLLLYRFLDSATVAIDPNMSAGQASDLFNKVTAERALLQGVDA